MHESPNAKIIKSNDAPEEFFLEVWLHFIIILGGYKIDRTSIILGFFLQVFIKYLLYAMYCFRQHWKYSGAIRENIIIFNVVYFFLDQKSS